MSWLNTRQACRRLNYRRRQLRRVAFAIDHRETPAGVEWAEESVLELINVMKTGVCPRCGYHSSLIIRHLRWCGSIPAPAELVVEYRTGPFGLYELANKYGLSIRLMRTRLMLGGVTLQEIETKRRASISFNYHSRDLEMAKCQNEACRIRIFTSPYQLPPRFEWRNHANIQGYCPACALAMKQVNPAELTALLNRPLH